MTGKKKLCKFHERERAELAERKLVDSWLCAFFTDVFCPHSKIPREKRMDSVCLRCSHLAEFEREMEEVERADAEFVEAVQKDPDAYLRGEI